MNKLRNDAGSVLVFITLMIVLLMVMVGMGLDTGYLAFSRSMGQRAVDMAALAAAAGLAKGDATAIKSNTEQLNATNDYVKSSGNVIDGTVNGKNVTLLTGKFDPTGNFNITGTTSDISSANAVRVGLETPNHNPFRANSNSAINTPAFLTPLMNLFGGGASAAGANNVSVSAVAAIAAEPGLPIALNGCDKTWEGTNTEIPWTQTPSGGSNPNNSGWTTYLDNSVSKPDIIKLIRKISACQGTGVVNVGTNICLNNGSQTPDLREMETLIGTEDDGITPKCYLTPVIPSSSNFTGCDNEILAYAQICPLAMCGPGVNGSKNQNLCNPKISHKYLLATVKSCNVGDPNRPAISSCYSLRLVREPQVGM